MSEPHIVIHRDLVQGSPEWAEVRRGMLTASEMDRIVTPTLKAASNDKERLHLWELLAQRITGYVEPSYISDSMLRGQVEEVEARREYASHFAPVEEVGFVVNGAYGFPIGCSPDGLVGFAGQLEIKSRAQRFQAQMLVEHVPRETIPPEHVIQCQTALLVTERAWLDFVSYCGGMPMAVVRVWPDAKVQDAILEAATAFEARLAQKLAEYEAALDSPARLIPTERILEQEMVL